MQNVFIINPAAGKRMDINRVQADLETLMKQRSDDWCIETTQCAGDAERIARNWCEKTNAPTRIYAFGGDGTLNEVVNGAAGYVHVEVGCCPLGSGNDFIKTYGTAEQFRDISALLDAPSYVTDLIDCNGRLSVNICSAGLDSRVGLGMANYKNLPFVTGKGAYIIR